MVGVRVGRGEGVGDGVRVGVGVDDGVDVGVAEGVGVIVIVGLAAGDAARAGTGVSAARRGSIARVEGGTFRGTRMVARRLSVTTDRRRGLQATRQRLTERGMSVPRFF